MTEHTGNSAATYELASNNRRTGPVAALGALFAEIIKTLRENQRVYHTYRTNRAAFRHMLTLDDDILLDIGVTRSDVIWASKLPKNKNAAQELSLVAKAKRRSERIK